ncbi:GtrA family protein [Pseudarthrobacter raffinosi]|uniref:GtrA family protein n=1 Tax=Pseudarthrobacter raffinosi TaxID=2953651 RepID=UPI00208FD3E2|nr:MULTISPECIES: GtrA family protein [unclassified Pseudarthrobacter]MCO4250993.1 GtrA family protein [Pseudarthrobacter sp. MDT3-9]MCO4263883.1 GtrA family protein [Pseudarthrobacter sp. MDT3-26]
MRSPTARTLRRTRLQEWLPARLRRLLRILAESPVIRFLIVGGLSFALDLGILAILHEGVGVDLWIATPIAFIASLVFNFLLQRMFTFRATNHRAVSAAKYLLLVLVNIVVSDLIVISFDSKGWSYVAGKVTATVLTTVWNYLLYRHWIFKSSESAAKVSS